MPGVGDFYQTLRAKLAPSVAIQARGSVDRAIKSSSTFGPQINHQGWTSFKHSQNPHIAKQLNKMNN
jgi:hypothetical protein